MRKLGVIIIGSCIVCSAAWSQSLNRGIGVYPGNPGEYRGPEMVKDSEYRNIALFRSATASSSVDRNLTAQLLTDGISEDSGGSKGSRVQGLPYLSVKVDGEKLGNRDMLRSLDHHMYTWNLITSERGSMEYDWHGMSPEIDQLKLSAMIAYYPEKSRGYRLTVESSSDGRKWKTIYSEKADTLPGVAGNHPVSSDPDKWVSPEMLPMRMLQKSISIPSAQYTHLRINIHVPGIKYIKLAQTLMLADGKEAVILPQDCFRSGWMSLTDGDEWVEVDLGTEARIDKVVPHWILEPAHYDVQIRDGRYVRLFMSGGNKAGHYAMSELEVMGTGGLKPADTGWQLQRVGDSHWIPATVPATVLASYMNIGAVPDNCYADNMSQISESYFNSDFLYRHSFSVPDSLRGRHIYLNFDGINWKAEITLNNQYIGRIDGAFMRGRFDVTSLLRDGSNELLVRVIHNANYGVMKEKNSLNTGTNGGILGADNPTFHASIGWDWITSVPGREVGIWNDVCLSADDGISLSDPLVQTHLNGSLASVTPSVMVRNNTPREQTFTLSGFIGDIKFSREVTLPAMTEKEVSFSPEEFPQLKDQHLRLWWPNNYGEQYLYEAGFQSSKVQGFQSSKVQGFKGSRVDFKAGIREVTYRDLDTSTQIYVNGKRFDPLGGNWGFPEINLNYRTREYDAAVRYHKEMNFNMIRNWVGQTADREFYEACDKYGIMVWQDFWLANPADGPDPYNSRMFLANSADFIKQIRQHPSIGIYVGRNEGFPPEVIDKGLRQQIDSLHPGLGYISHSAAQGVSGGGPYNMLSMEEYFKRQSHKIHSERGMPNIPSYESFCRMIPPADRWPQNIQWGKHDFTLEGAQSGQSFNDIMEERFGKPRSAEEFCRLGQVLNYDGYRAMYEGAQQYRRGLLIWMSHSCWPSMVWDTYDYYFEPTAAFFGARKACEPLHIQYNPLNKSVEIVNMLEAEDGLKATSQLLSSDGKLVWEKTAYCRIAADTTIQAMPLQPSGDSTQFIRLYLRKGDTILSDNFYVNYGKEGLKPATDKPQSVYEGVLPADGTVTISNATDKPMLYIRVNLLAEDGEQILPVHYSENYFSLMPGESKTVSITYDQSDARGQKARVTAATSVSSFHDR